VELIPTRHFHNFISRKARSGIASQLF
jgi:hypothetical protein